MRPGCSVALTDAAVGKRFWSVMDSIRCENLLCAWLAGGTALWSKRRSSRS